ncbi:MAG: IS6 family transposase [Vulcanimicrobiaceae bacterium]
MGLAELFKGRHFDAEIIVLCVRWYLGYKLSYRDLAEMMAERGVSVAPSTILRWVQHYAPEFEKRWNRFARPVGGSWRVDETYIKVRGHWVYLYRAVDARGQTVDFRLSPKRDVAAAKAFFRKAFKTQGRLPRTITLDGYQASHRAVRELRAENRKLRAVTVRSCQYLNNIVEQDHRGVKRRLRPMLGFKNFGHAAITIAGVELLHRIRKNQFALNRLRVGGRSTPEIWNAVLAA